MSPQNTSKNAKSIDEIIKEFNVSTFEILNEYRYQKDKCDRELKKLCYENSMLLAFPQKSGEKIVEFINKYTSI